MCFFPLPSGSKDDPLRSSTHRSTRAPRAYLKANRDRAMRPVRGGIGTACQHRQLTHPVSCSRLPGTVLPRTSITKSTFCNQSHELNQLPVQPLDESRMPQHSMARSADSQRPGIPGHASLAIKTTLNSGLERLERDRSVNRYLRKQKKWGANLSPRVGHNRQHSTFASRMYERASFDQPDPAN